MYFLERDYGGRESELSQPQVSRAMLRAGANDLGGTLMEETISRMAGSEHGSAKTVEELVAIGAGIDRPVRQRTTTYDPVPVG